MSEQPPTPDDVITDEMRERVAARRREMQPELDALEAQRQERQSFRDGLRSMPEQQLHALARENGVDLSRFEGRPAPERPECLVCAGSSSIDEVGFGLVSLLCDEHAEELTKRVASEMLRPVIPEGLHDAKPAQLLSSLAEWNPSLGGLYLFGDVGTGKSHQAAILVKLAWAYLRKQRTDRMPRIVWRNVPDMMDAIAATFGSKDTTYDFTAVREADVLVLDDIGIGDNMPFAVRKLYVLLEHRLHARKSTIVTSNRDIDDLGIHLDSPQIASRLTQMCAQVSFEGLPDRRPDLSPRLKP